MSRARITGAVKVGGIVGNPVAHSLSPVIHNGWIEAAGMDAASTSPLRSRSRPSPSRIPRPGPHRTADRPISSSSATVR